MGPENIDSSSHLGGPVEKHAPWSYWAVKHYRALRVAREAGLLVRGEGWINVVEHSLVVNAGSVLVAREIQKAGNNIDVKRVDDGSILHDIAKRRNKEAKIGRNQEKSEGKHLEILSQAGYGPEIIDMVTYTGRVPEINLSPEEQDAAIAEISIEKLIVAYIDARVRNDVFVSLEEARDKNKQKVPDDAAFYDSWYVFYKKVEQRIFSLAGEGFNPEDLNNDSVFEMVAVEAGYRK